jgi:hypothetical protein
MNLKLQKLYILVTLLSCSLSMFATHYINHTGKTIIVTNASAKKRTKKSYFSYFTKKSPEQEQTAELLCFIEIENDQEGDLDNSQGDEITITSHGMSDKRKLFPTNNSFNYVITLNKYKPMFEKFDINHAGAEEEIKAKKAKAKAKAKAKKVKVKKIKTKKYEQIQ